MLRPVNVARAAPVTPSLGKGPQPKMRQGSRTRLMMLETQSKRMATAASPAPRKIALLRKRSMMAPLPPRPIAKTRLRSDSVRPTVATASAPRRPTQKTSTTAKRDSSTISITMGMARRRIARLRLPAVKSWCEPRRASRTELQRAGGAAVTDVCSNDIETVAICVGAYQDTGALTRLRQLKSRNGREDQIRARGGLKEFSDLRDEHGHCPWRYLCVSTAPDVRIFTDTIGTTEFYLERV